VFWVYSSCLSKMFTTHILWSPISSSFSYPKLSKTTQDRGAIKENSRHHRLVYCRGARISRYSSYKPAGETTDAKTDT
jgi:hypothetical protein